MPRCVCAQRVNVERCPAIYRSAIVRICQCPRVGLRLRCRAVDKYRCHAGVFDGDSHHERRGQGYSNACQRLEQHPQMRPALQRCPGAGCLRQSLTVFERAAYWTTATDGSGQRLRGRHVYVLHIPAGKLPPNGAFWSLTMSNRTWISGRASQCLGQCPRR